MKTNYTILFWLILWCAGLAILGCIGKAPAEPDTRTVPKTIIVRVFYHEYNHYSVMEQQPDQSLVITDFSKCRNIVRLISDVPRGEPMWYAGKRVKPDWTHDGWWMDVVIHIHSQAEIHGGGWDHGKHGSGQTNVIE